MVFGSNATPGLTKSGGKQWEKAMLKHRNVNSLLNMSAEEFFSFSLQKNLNRKTEKKYGKNFLKDNDCLQSYLRKVKEKSVKRLDSCIARDINGKIFAKDYYYYYPEGTYPAGALKSNEIWSLDEEHNEWNGFRMSATYDEFGNANNRLIEVTEGGIWVPQVRYTATYTSLEGELLLDMTEIYQNGEWIGDGKRTATFDNQGRKVTMNVFVWNADTKGWDNLEKADYTYESGKSTESGYQWTGSTWIYTTKLDTYTDQNGNSTKVENSRWDNEKNDWLVDMRIENTYDSEGNLILSQNYNYVEEYGELLPYGKEIHTYNGNEIEVEYYGYNYDTEEWDGFNKSKEKYEDDLVVENYFYTWAADTKTWVNDTKGVHEYNNEGKPVFTINYFWDGTAWKNNSKVAIEYNEYGYESHNVSYLFDEAVNDWFKESELFTDTDPEGRILRLEGYMLDEEGNWSGAGMKEVYEYDENGRSLRDEFSKWNLESGEWEIDEIADYFYSLVSSDIEGAKENATEVVVYCANGCINVLNASNEEISVYSANGMLIRQTTADANNQSIRVDKGFYIVRVGVRSFKINVRN